MGMKKRIMCLALDQAPMLFSSYENFINLDELPSLTHKGEDRNRC